MRQIGVLPDAFQARTLGDYLLTLRIETRVEQTPDGWALWVCDEDRVPQARQELAAFIQEPKAPRYTGVSHAADAIRQEEDAVEQDYSQRQTELRQLMREPQKQRRGRYVTLAVSAVAVMIFLAAEFGANRQNPALQALFIAPFRESPDGKYIFWDGLSRITAGEVWRLITPVFIHFNVLHILFNVLMFNDLGGAFEERRGMWRFVLFFLAVAVASNLAQYYLNLQRTDQGLIFRPNPAFGGLSGVVYGFFGYVWMKSRYEPDLGLRVSLNEVLVMLGWFVLCLTGLVGPVANVAHGAGLALGVLIGVVPVWWRKL